MSNYGYYSMGSHLAQGADRLQLPVSRGTLFWRNQGNDAHMQLIAASCAPASYRIFPKIITKENNDDF
jgi:hypothetical protein